MDDDGGSAGGKSPVSVGASSPARDRNGHGNDASRSSRGGGERGDRGGDGGGGGYQAGATTRPKSKKDWVRFDGAAMLLSSAGWSDDEDEEKEELITSEIEKFRQKQAERDKKLEDERRQELQRKIKDAQRREKQKEEDVKRREQASRVRFETETEKNSAQS